MQRSRVVCMLAVFAIMTLLFGSVVAKDNAPPASPPRHEDPVPPVPQVSSFAERLVALQKRIAALQDLQVSLEAERDRLELEQMDSAERMVGEIEAEGERVRTVEFPAIVKNHKAVEAAFKLGKMNAFTALTEEFARRLGEMLPTPPPPAGGGQQK